MPSRRIATVCLMAMAMCGPLLRSPAQSPLPELRVEATDGGSVLHVRNGYSQPLTAFLIELVGYPGSAFSLWHDDYTVDSIAAGATRAFPITNMTVGAVPEYVKMQAAIYADGATAGVAEKATQLVERRRHCLTMFRDLIQRLEAHRAANKPKDTVVASLKEWAEGLPEPTRRNRNSQETINNNAARSILLAAVESLKEGSLAKLLTELQGKQRALNESRPRL